MGIRGRPGGSWQPVSRAALIGWLIFYGLLLAQAARAGFGDYLLLDYVNFFSHEGGHFFFSWFGETLTILGGTLAQLLVPLLLAVYFAWHRQTSAVAFASFWFFENFLPTGTYMADARIQTLPLVGPGGGDPEGHDWTNLFVMWNLLGYERQIGGTTRFLGWVGMLATIAWFIWTSRRTASVSAVAARK